MKTTLITLAAATVLGAALPALAGQAFDSSDDYALAREWSSSPPKGFWVQPMPSDERPGEPRPYALTGNTPASQPSTGWTITVESYGRYPQVVYRR